MNDLSQMQAVSSPRLSDAGLLAAFPEAKEIVPALIKELTEKRSALVQCICDELTLIYAQSEDKVYRHHWRVWLMLHEGEELEKVDRKLSRLHRLENKIDGKPAPLGNLSDSMIEAANAIPITNIVGEPNQRSLCICPLHDDHKPSMRIYTKQNRAWCYVCNDGGDPIKLYTLMNGCDFKTAVRELSGGLS
jgi:hypothetical protein